MAKQTELKGTNAGLEKLRVTATKIKTEAKVEAKARDQELAEIFSDINLSTDVAGFYKENAELGTENLGGESLPLLKITENGSIKNLDQAGNRSPIGQFYYKPTKQSFEELGISLMTVSRGFYTKNEDPKPGDKLANYNQLLGGMILENLQPFIFFSTSTRCSAFWDFAKKIKPLTKSVPMMGLEIKMTVEKKEGDGKVWHIANYELVKDEEGKIQLINDLDLLNTIKSGVQTIEDTFEGFISTKEVDRVTGKPLSGQVGVAQEGEEVFTDDTPPSPVLKDDIPF